jgi:hypothetical protein
MLHLLAFHTGTSACMYLLPAAALQHVCMLAMAWHFHSAALYFYMSAMHQTPQLLAILSLASSLTPHHTCIRHHALLSLCLIELCHSM